MLKVVKGGSKYPRGAERRHFRGEFSIRAIKKLAAGYNNGRTLVKELWKRYGPFAFSIMNGVKKDLYGFGDWIKWKIPDMMERLDIRNVIFTPSDVHNMFDASVQGAKLYAKQEGITKEILDTVSGRLMDKIGSMTAPPTHNREINIQELETVLCKWKSHMNGHYPVGKDIIEIAEGLKRYSKESPTAKRMLREARKMENKL